MWLILSLLIIAYLAYFAYTVNFSYWKKRGIPHPPFSKLFGNVTDAILLKKSVGQVYHDIYCKYSSLEYVGAYQIRRPVVVLRDPELIKDVLLKNFYNFYQNDVCIDEEKDRIIALNPFFTSNIEQWKSTRSQIMPTFTNKQMKFNFPLIELVCKRLVEFLNNPKIANGGIDVKELCQKYTMDVVANCVVGLEANSFISSNNDFDKYVKKIISRDTLTNIKLLLVSLVPSLAKLLKLRLITDEVGNYFKTIIKKTIQYRIKNKVERNDVLTLMHQLQLKLGKEEFSDDHLTSHILSYFLDGYETSAITLSFAIFELAANQQCQRKLREEIDNAFSKCEGQFNFDIMQEMNYLNKVINETLRIHPTVMILTKRCTKEYELPPLKQNGKGVLVEPGTTVIIPIYSLHTDPIYFPEPHQFDPERFSEENSYNRFAFLPFGEGPRMCIGKKFALTQVKIAIIYILLNYEITVNEKTITPLEIDPGYSLMAAKGGLWVNFVQRHK